MNRIKKKIEQNRDLFDDQVPSSGHMERFEALLKSQNEQKRKHTKKVKLTTIFSVAASIAILIAIGVKFYTPDNGGNSIPGNEITGTTDEFNTTNEYYNQKMDEKIADIMCKLAYTSSDNQAQLKEDIEKMVEEKNNFINEISKSEDKEMAIHFLVKHYKTNIYVLENIDEKLGKYTNC